MPDFYEQLRSADAPYIIAEIGSNHNGDMDLAKRLIVAAKDCGCDCVKFQSWTPQSLIAREEYERNQKYEDSPKKHFGSLKQMVERYYLRTEQHFELSAFCREVGIEFLSTPFSREEADLLDSIGVPFFKIASMDVNNVDFLRYVASKQKPVVLSTGMATMEEIDRAVRAIEAEGNRRIAVLHCISIYPPSYEDIHLNNIPSLIDFYGYPVGFSDHSIGIAIPLASVALGACIIEKHFTLDKDLDGWDHAISADPGEMKAIVAESRNVKRALGSRRRIVSAEEEAKKQKFRRSLVTASVMKAGQVITRADLTYKRPGTGIEPNEMERVIGRTLRRDIDADELIHWSDLV